MPKPTKDQLGRAQAQNDPEKEAFKADRRSKWDTVWERLDEGDVETARALIAQLQAEATERYRREIGEIV